MHPLKAGVIISIGKMKLRSFAYFYYLQLPLLRESYFGLEVYDRGMVTVLQLSNGNLLSFGYEVTLSSAFCFSAKERLTTGNSAECVSIEKVRWLCSLLGEHEDSYIISIIGNNSICMRSFGTCGIMNTQFSHYVA